MYPPSKSRLGLLTAALVAALGGTACNTVTTEQPHLWGQEVSLTILHTSDIHSRVLPYDFNPNKTDQDLGLRPDAAPYGGLSRLSAMIANERARSQRAIHLDSGDCFQGAPIFNAHNGEVEVRWLSQVQADAVVVGNHEFDAGVQNFSDQYADWGSYPLLSANYDWYDWQDPRFSDLGRLTKPYTIIQADGLRIAVIGMANISSLNSIGEDGNSLQVAPLEQNETARAWVEMLSPHVDLVGVVSHLGLTEDQELVQGYTAVYRKEQIRSLVQRANDPWEILEELEDGKVLVRIPGVRNLDFIAGGHLHVVTNPPQMVQDADGRKVILFHSGAFAKYLGRLDLVVKMPPPPEEQTAEQRFRGAEIVAHDYYAFPVDAVWCYDRRVTPELAPQAQTDVSRTFIETTGRHTCEAREDWRTLRLLEPYVQQLGTRFDLQRIFAYAPREILRRSSSVGGDSPLGNMTARSMQIRRGVEAEFSMTNTLGIRDSLYRGPVSIESMFNVFPFENTINIMYLSGDEIQELFDFVASRSSGRGCQSQAQIAGARFVMDCAQSNRNYEYRVCKAVSDCHRPDDPAGIPWECRANGTCWAHPGRDITIGGEPVAPSASYKVAVNDYIAKGGSGFTVLKRNTTRFETGISLRDALIQYMSTAYCSCEQLLAEGAAERCDANHVEEGGEWILDPQALSFCRNATDFHDMWMEILRLSPEARDVRLLDPDAPTVYAGKCNCNDVLASDLGRRDQVCGAVTPELEQFCKNPLHVPIVTGVEDNRIGRRLK